MDYTKPLAEVIVAEPHEQVTDKQMMGVWEIMNLGPADVTTAVEPLDGGRRTRVMLLPLPGCYLSSAEAGVGVIDLSREHLEEALRTQGLTPTSQPIGVA